jgi:hypothetical protein
MKIGAFLLLFGRTKRPDLDWAKNSLAEGEGFIFLKVARRQSSPDSIGHSSNAFFGCSAFSRVSSNKASAPNLLSSSCAASASSLLATSALLCSGYRFAFSRMKRAFSCSRTRRAWRITFGSGIVSTPISKSRLRYKTECVAEHKHDQRAGERQARDLLGLRTFKSILRSFAAAKGRDKFWRCARG